MIRLAIAFTVLFALSSQADAQTCSGQRAVVVRSSCSGTMTLQFAPAPKAKPAQAAPRKSTPSLVLDEPVPVSAFIVREVRRPGLFGRLFGRRTTVTDTIFVSQP